MAQLTYRYYNAKKPDAPEDSGPDDYEFKIYPGSYPDEPFRIHAMRKNIPLLFIDALRDIASDNRVWRRSPLSRLVELTDLKTKQLEPFAQEISSTSSRVVTLPPLSGLQTDVKTRPSVLI